MSTTRLGVVIDALVTTLDAALTADVVDGPAVQAPGIGRDVLYIGWSGDEGDSEAGNAAQEFAALGRQSRNETLSITCRAQATRGETVMKPTRDAALALTEAVEAALRSDPQLGGALSGGQWASYGSTDRLIEQQTSQGSLCGVVFTVTAFARI